MNKKSGLHPKNKNKNGYDFDLLLKAHAPLKEFMIVNKTGMPSIDFSNANAVLALNTALLKALYGIKFWAIPEGFLCPPVPGRADYIHHVSELLQSPEGKIPEGKRIHMLDIGTGANCIYPLIAHHEFGWSVTGTDIDEKALHNAEQIIKENKLENDIKIVRQKDSLKFFENVVGPEDYFHLTVCNPPFHSSPEEAASATLLKNKNLGLSKFNQNFGGQHSELWCPGGEKEFILRMINESLNYKKQTNWITCLVSKAETLPFLYEEFKKLGIKKVRTIDMAQGQKKSRIIAWSLW